MVALEQQYIKNGDNGVKTIHKFDADYAEQEPPAKRRTYHE